MNTTRRHFFDRAATGIGTVALASLLNDNLFAKPKLPDLTAALPGLPHFAAKAKRVIYMYQSGAPSQVDLFDDKPSLEKLNGQNLPDSIRQGQRLTGMTSRQKTFPAAKSFTKFNAHGKSGTRISDLLPWHAKIVDEMWSLRGRQSSLEAGERAKATAEAKAYKTQLTERKNDAVTALKEGQVPPDFAELMDEVRATGDFKLINDLDEEKAFFDAGVNFRALPLDVQAQYLSEQAARRDMSGDEAELFKRLEASHNKIRSDIASGNGLLRAAKDGLFDQSLLAVPNIQTPDDFANFLRQRDGMASLAQSHYGVPIDRLNPAEVSDMVEQYANTDTDGKLQLFGAIVDNLQPEAAVQLLEQFDKKGASNFAMAGAVYIDGAPDVAARILKGQSTPSEIMPKKADINQAIFDEIGNVYMGDLTGAATVSVMNAIKAVYAYDSFIAGDVSAELDPTRLESAINEVTGGIATIEWNGSGVMFDDDYSVPVPVRGMDSDDMETWLESITADDLMQQGGTHSAFPETQVAELLNDGQLKLIFARGFGDKAGYMLQTYNGGFVLGSDGLVFLLEHSPGAE